MGFGFGLANQVGEYGAQPGEAHAHARLLGFGFGLGLGLGRGLGGESKG